MERCFIHVLFQNESLILFFFYTKLWNQVNVLFLSPLYIHGCGLCRYWVFRSWGRVGTTIGGNKLDKFHDKNSAMDNFLGVYKEKTGNNWGSSNFTKYPNKFYPLEIDYGQVQFVCAFIDCWPFFPCVFNVI